MVVLRPTARLAAKLRLKLAAAKGRSDTRLGDWYANDIALGRRRLVLCVSELSRLAVVLDAAPYASIPERLGPAVGVLLHRIGAPTEAINRELMAMSTIEVAKTQNRSIIGSMLEYQWSLKVMHEHGDLGQSGDLLPISVYLSKVVSMVLPETFPREAALRLLSQGPESQKSN